MNFLDRLWANSYLRTAIILALFFMPGDRLISAAVDAAAQFVSPGAIQVTSPIGTEQIPVTALTTGGGAPAAYAAYVQENTIRNTTGYLLTSSTTGTITMTCAANRVIFTAASASATLDVCPNPPDGQMLEVVNGSGGAFTQLTLASTDSSTFTNGNTTGALAAGASKEWQYTATSKVWYAMR